MIKWAVYKGSQQAMTEQKATTMRDLFPGYYCPTDEEFKEHNIFDSNHQNYQEFINIINIDFNYDKIDYGNLTEYRNI